MEAFYYNLDRGTQATPYVSGGHGGEAQATRSQPSQLSQEIPFGFGMAPSGWPQSSGLKEQQNRDPGARGRQGRRG